MAAWQLEQHAAFAIPVPSLVRAWSNAISDSAGTSRTLFPAKRLLHPASRQHLRKQGTRVVNRRMVCEIACDYIATESPSIRQCVTYPCAPPILGDEFVRRVLDHAASGCQIGGGPNVFVTVDRRGYFSH